MTTDGAVSECTVGLDVERVREDFAKTLAAKIDDHGTTFGDSGASSYKPWQVTEAMANFQTELPANVHRGAYDMSEEATDRFEAARSKVARFIGADPCELVFVRNTTEAINLLGHSLRSLVGPGDEILTDVSQHHANLVPWHLLANLEHCRLEVAGVTPDGRLDLEDWYGKLSRRTKLVAISHASNVLGCEMPVAELVKAAHDVGALVVVDGAQGAPHLPVDVKRLGCDCYVWSAHKMVGPSGIGALYAPYPLLETMPPYQYGGGMVERFSLDAKSVWKKPPEKFEAGTPNIVGAIGFGAAVDYLTNLGMGNIHQYERELASRLYAGLAGVPGLRMLGTFGPDRLAIASFVVEAMEPGDLANKLNDQFGIAIRTGRHCAHPLHDELGLESTARISLYIYNTLEEVDLLVDGIKQICGVA